MNYKVTVLTPIHIGGAKEKQIINELDGFVRDRFLIVPSAEDLLEKLSVEDIFNLDKSWLSTTVSKKSIGDQSSLMIPISLDIQERIRQSKEKANSKNMFFKLNIRSGLGVPYIPGSSIKGAIMSAIAKAIDQVPSFNPNSDFDESKIDHPKKHFISEEKKIDTETTTLDIAMLLKVGDCSFRTNETKIETLYTYGYFQDQRSHEMVWAVNKLYTEFVEVVAAGAKGDVNISLSSFNHDSAEEDKKTYPSKLIELHKYGSKFKDLSDHIRFANLINKYSIKLLSDELAYLQFRRHSIARLKKHSELKEKITQLIASNSKSFILRVAYGGGFNSASGNWIFKDHITSFQTLEGQDKKYEIVRNQGDKPSDRGGKKAIVNLSRGRKLLNNGNNSELPLGYLLFEPINQIFVDASTGEVVYTQTVDNSVLPTITASTQPTIFATSPFRPINPDKELIATLIGEESKGSPNKIFEIKDDKGNAYKLRARYPSILEASLYRVTLAAKLSALPKPTGQPIQANYKGKA